MLIFFCFVGYLIYILTDTGKTKLYMVENNYRLLFLKFKIFYMRFVIGSIILTDVYANINRVLEHIIME